MSKAEHRCPKCAGLMDRGAFRIQSIPHSHLRIQFVIPGVKTSWNPIKAFQQGLADEVDDKTFDLSAMGGYLCQTCGYIDMYAWFADERPEG